MQIFNWVSMQKESFGTKVNLGIPVLEMDAAQANQD